jgi:hypothetical protein
MKRYSFLFTFLLFVKLIFFGQNDSIKCDETYRIPEGIYINYEDFRKNNPVKREQIETNLSKDQLDFFGKTLDAEKFAFTGKDGKTIIESKKVWGFYQNNALHINYNNKFYRVPVFGAISYLVALVEVLSPSYYPTYGGSIGGSVGTTIKTQEMREFILNFYNGLLTPFTMNEAELLISRDSVLFAEYKTLKRKKQKEQITRYIRKYNELHPVYFLK